VAQDTQAEREADLQQQEANQEVANNWVDGHPVPTGALGTGIFPPTTAASAEVAVLNQRQATASALMGGHTYTYPTAGEIPADLGLNLPAGASQIEVGPNGQVNGFVGGNGDYVLGDGSYPQFNLPPDAHNISIDRWGLPTWEDCQGLHFNVISAPPAATLPPTPSGSSIDPGYLPGWLATAGNLGLQAAHGVTDTAVNLVTQPVAQVHDLLAVGYVLRQHNAGTARGNGIHARDCTAVGRISTRPCGQTRRLGPAIRA